MLTKLLIVAGLYAVFALVVLALSARKRKKTGDQPSKANIVEILLVGAAGCAVILFAAAK